MTGQRRKITLAFIGILLLVGLTAILDFPEFFTKQGINLPQSFIKPFSLGLDLQGGAHLVYQADLSQIPSEDYKNSIEGVRDVIERRVNAFGVAEPIVQTTQSGDSWRVIVELAGVFDVNDAINMIGETPLLEFKEQNPNPVVALTDEQKQQLESFNQQTKTTAEEVLVKVLTPEADFAALAKEYSTDPGSKDSGGDLGFWPRGQLVPEFEKVCFDELKPGQLTQTLVQSQFGYHIIKKIEERGEGENYEAHCAHILIGTATEANFIDPNNQWLYTGLTGKQLKKSQVEFDNNTQEPNVALEFNTEGSDLFGQITERNVGKPVAIFLDGQPISIPIVQTSITSGQAIISGNFTIQEAKLLAQRLNAGALPVPIELISQQTVGATLGQDSLNKSLKAGLIGLLIIAIFMILFYRLPGLVATFSLLSYGLLLMGIFKMIPVTLTLAGIAGFILSLGMAVDANVLIFERIKEELRAGKNLEIAIREGFQKAWPSIFDGNVSTLLTCFILMGFTTSLVKGFAVTLSLGIIVSIISAMVITKVILQLLIRFKPLTAIWLFDGKKTKFK